MNPLAQLLAQAEQELQQAKQLVAELQVNVDALRVAKDSYDQHIGALPGVKPFILPILAPLTPPPVVSKNTRGMVTPTILAVLGDGKARTVEETLIEVNEKLPSPTSRASLRSTLGNLKEKGAVTSASYGKYQIAAQKCETPSDTSGNS